jgi:hypothetical protein
MMTRRETVAPTLRLAAYDALVKEYREQGWPEDMCMASARSGAMSVGMVQLRKLAAGVPYPQWMMGGE